MKQQVTVRINLDVPLMIETDGAGFHAYSSALRGLHVGGDTEAEVQQNALDGTLLYLRSLVRHGEALPSGVRLSPVAALCGDRTGPCPVTVEEG